MLIQMEDSITSTRIRGRRSERKEMIKMSSTSAMEIAFTTV